MKQLNFILQVEQVDTEQHTVDVTVNAFNEEKQPVVEGFLKVSPPY